MPSILDFFTLPDPSICPEDPGLLGLELWARTLVMMTATA